MRQLAADGKEPAGPAKLSPHCKCQPDGDGMSTACAELAKPARPTLSAHAAMMAVARAGFFLICINYQVESGPFCNTLPAVPTRRSRVGRRKTQGKHTPYICF